VEVLIIRLLKEWCLMAAVGRIPRRRGGVCGLLLILLGAWGGLAPFIGPQFHFAFTPDKAWAYTSGRLYLSAIPGGVALLAGLVILLTRSRAVGVLAGILGALGGIWFLIGPGVVATLVQRPDINTGIPVAYTGVSGRLATDWTYFEDLGIHVLPGILILLVAGIVAGRLSMLGANDVSAEDDGYDDFSGPIGLTETQPAGTFTPNRRPYAGEETTQTQDAVPPPFGGSSGDYPSTSASPFPPAEPPSTTFPRTQA
jgi:hypothetical protein